MSKTLLILGAGGHGKVVADCALACGWEDVAFLDDRYPQLSSIGHWPVIGKIDFTAIDKTQYKHLALGVGNNKLRLKWLKQGVELGFVFPALLHPSAVVSPFASVGDGSVVFAKAVINVDAQIGRAVIINTASVVEHDCVVADACHISPTACMAGEVSLGEYSWLGMGANIIQCITVGSGVIIGAGAVVVANIADDQTVVGIPAKPLK